MKIAMIHTPIQSRGGGERQLLSLANELQKRGHTVEIFVSAVNEENSYPELLKNLTINVIPHPLGNRLPRWLKPVDPAQSQKTDEDAAEQSSKLRSWMRKAMGRQFYTIPYELPTMLNIGRKIPKGFDVINNHNFPSEWAAFAAKKRLAAPVVWMCNEPPFWFFVPEVKRGLNKINWPVYELLDKIAVGYIDDILVLSHTASGYVREAYNRASSVVRSGVDVDRFRKASGAAFREEHGLEKDFVLLQVGTLELNKRQVDAVKALEILSKRHSRVKLVFDGGGRRGSLMRLSEQLGVKDKIVYVRSRNDEELAEVYAACDVFVFPAQITWGLAVVEAMAAAKPVIVSRKCGVAEIISQNVNGILIDHARPEELAKQVELLLENPKLRKKLGQNAREYVKNNFSWEKYATRIEEIFEKAITNYAK